MLTDPKCWECGCFVQPPEPIRYCPLICSDCSFEYKLRKFIFVRASQQEIDELFPVKEIKGEPSTGLSGTQ